MVTITITATATITITATVISVTVTITVSATISYIVTITVSVTVSIIITIIVTIIVCTESGPQVPSPYLEYARALESTAPNRGFSLSHSVTQSVTLSDSLCHTQLHQLVLALAKSILFPHTLTCSVCESLACLPLFVSHCAMCWQWTYRQVC